MADQPESQRARPQIEFRWGGFRVTVQRIPVRLITAVAALAGAWSAAWVTVR